jgi:hypothetical protein
MPRVLVLSDDGELVWNERATASDFETDRYRRCLAHRLGWAVADAWRLSTVKPLRVNAADQRPCGGGTLSRPTATAA